MKGVIVAGVMVAGVVAIAGSGLWALANPELWWLPIPLAGAALLVIIELWTRATRAEKVAAAAPTAPKWTAHGEELALLARHGGPDEAFFHNAHVLSIYPWAGGLPKQRQNGGLN